MVPSATPIADEHSSISWPIQSIAISSDFKSSEPAYLLLDRANAEFGLVHQSSPGVAVMAQFPDTGEPIFFQASKARSICTRFNNTCKKVSVLLQNMQIDLHFKASADAGDFVDKIRRLAFKTGNLQFEVHEAVSNAAFARAEFSMEHEGYTDQECGSWMSVSNDKTPDWACIYKTGKCSDFTIVAGGERFPVHRVLLSTRSQYFNAVCDGYFAVRNPLASNQALAATDILKESEKRLIELPESVFTVRTMLHELYGVYNQTTGSIFTGFALECIGQQWVIMDELLTLFIACDKYNLESIQQKAAETFIDRLSLIHDSWFVVKLASNIYCECPEVDRGLRNAIIGQLHVRLLAIMEDEKAWKVYSENKILVKALHWYQCEMQDSERSVGMFTPPPTPKKK